MAKNSKARGYFAVGLASFILGGTIGLKLGNGSYNKTIPDHIAVEEGFMIPGNLEITVKDFDENGIPSVIGTYNGRKILWKLDENGLPKAVEYKIEPTKIIEVGKQK